MIYLMHNWYFCITLFQVCEQLMTTLLLFLAFWNREKELNCIQRLNNLSTPLDSFINTFSRKMMIFYLLLNIITMTFAELLRYLTIFSSISTQYLVINLMLKFLSKLWSINFYFTIEGMVKYCNRAWKKCFFPSFFSKYLKNGWNYFDTKNWAKPWHFGLQKSPNKWTSKNYIFWDNNCFVKMSVSLLDSLYVTFFCERASSKTNKNFKTKFHK